MVKTQIASKLKVLTGHPYIEILDRGNSAIWSAFQLAKKKVLVPEEGGWLTYLAYPKKLGLKLAKVKTNRAMINLKGLEQKTKTADLFLYQNPGGYHAEQPAKEIYQLCRKNNCLVAVDVSGALGTKLCRGDYADILVGSFGRWKLIDAGVGGFISCRNKKIFGRIKSSFKILKDEEKLKTILEKINHLPDRINFLLKRRKKIIEELKNFEIINKNHLGFVLIVKFSDDPEKERIVDYCHKNSLEYTECPRYIRINQKAISIEVKRLR